MLKASILLVSIPLLSLSAHALTQPETTEPEAVEEIEDTTGSAATRVFTPADFERFTPRTALDMVQQIPGFQIEEQDNEQRGFGQASGNVLINGQRLSGKSNDAIEALGRIPASAVIRIELQDGAQLDIPGLSGQVANIVAEQTGGLSGAWTALARFRRNVDPSFLNGTFSVSGKKGALDWTLSLENENPRNGNEGTELLLDAANTIIETREEETRFANEIPSVNVALAWKPQSGVIANLNASYEQFNFSGREIRAAFPVGLPEEDSLRLFRFGNDGETSEISGDYEFKLGPGRLKLIGVQTNRSRFNSNQVVTTLLADNSSGGSRFTQESKENESIARLEYAFSPKDGRDWQVSVEGAFNSLDSDVNLFLIDTPGGMLTPTDLQDQNTRVEELRAEGNLTYSRQLTPKLNAQASVGAEFSELSSSGSNGLTRQFFRPKGFASLAWRPSSNTTLSTRIEREVGQLNFFDFVSTVNLNFDNEQSGNPDIVPQQAWIGEVELEQRFGNAATISVRTFGEQITDIVDRIPISTTAEAPGNLDSATRYGVELNATFRFDQLGAKGLQLEFEGEARNSSLDDPLTGLSRRINNDTVSFLFTEIRYDVPSTPYALGLGYSRFRQAPNFRLDQIQRRDGERGFMDVFFEHKDIFGMTGIVRAGNLLNQIDFEARDVFVNRRNDSPLSFVETRDRTFGPILTVELRGSF